MRVQVRVRRLLLIPTRRSTVLNTLEHGPCAAVGVLHSALRVKAVYGCRRASRRIVGVFRLAAGRASAVEFIIQASPGCALRRRSTSLALPGTR